MTEFWEQAFKNKQKMWGESPAISAESAKDYFIEKGAQSILIPGIGYGRNAIPFMDAKMSVSGIEISQTAIDIAKNELNLDIKIHHGSVTKMPFSEKKYDGIFCYALIHLLGSKERKKLIKDCYDQIKPGGSMVFTAISKDSPSYGKGEEIGTDRFEMHGGIQMFFYSEDSIKKEFSEYGLVIYEKIEEFIGKGSEARLPFYIIYCQKE